MSANENNEAANDEPPKQITQAQLSLCEVALNVSAMQWEVSAQLCNANGQPTLAREFAMQAFTSRQLAALIAAKKIIGVQIIRATSLETH